MDPIFLDTFTSRVHCTGVLVTRSGLHIGAGESGDPLATDAPVVRDGRGRPYVPGSSLKGVVRSAAENLLRGAAARPADPTQAEKTPTLWSCSVHAGGEPCVSHPQLKIWRESHGTLLEEQHQKELEKGELSRERLAELVQRAVARQVWKESCTICRLFGSLALASRVRFPDLPLNGDLPPLEVRNGVGIDRDKGLAADSVLYNFEAVPPGTGFKLNLVFDNATDAEIGLLLYLFEQLNEGHLALGGKTSRGLGQVEVQWIQLQETHLGKDNPFASLLSHRDLLTRKTTAGAKEAEQVPELPAEESIPESGDPEAWRVLSNLIRQMPKFDRSTLAQEAKQKGLTKHNLNEHLGLNLSNKQKPWDEALGRLVQCGNLVFRAADKAYLPAEAVTPQIEEIELQPEETEENRDPKLQPAYDRFLGAMARLWEESF